MRDIYLGAFTTPGSVYPSFISIGQTGDEVDVIVRSAAGSDGACGEMARIRLSSEDFALLLATVSENCRLAIHQNDGCVV